MNRLENENNYKYYAFISYKHEDKYWANKLYRDIQTYHLPAEKRSEYKNGRISPIFIDHQEHSVATYDEAILSNCKLSKYLIVICSRATKNEPDYIDGEIEAFLSVNESNCDRIIPIIVDDCEAPEENCFPKKLKELGIIAANINDCGKKRFGKNRVGYRSAFISIMSTMLGLKPTDLESFDKRQRKKQFRNKLLATIIGVLVMGIGVFFIARYYSSNSLSLDILSLIDDNWSAAKILTADVGDEIQYRVLIDNIGDKDNPILTIDMDRNLKYISGCITVHDNTVEKTFNIDEEDAKSGIHLKNYFEEEDIFFDFTIRVINYDLLMTGNDLIVRTIVDNDDENLEQTSLVSISFLDEKNDDDIVITGWGDNIGGREVFTTEQVNKGDVLGDRIIFNSISDWEPIGGDERDFVNARKDNGINAGKDNIWHSHKIYVTEEGTYLIRMYVHNDNPNGKNALAKDVMAHVTMPLETGNLLGIQCSIDSSNASPSRYWDGVNFESNRLFYLDYIEGSAFYENNGIGSDGGCRLRDEIITADGVKLGFDKMDGIIPGGEYYAAYVSFKVRIVFVDDKDYFHVDTRVRKDGDTEWVDIVDAEIGDVVEYAIKYENTTNTSRENVMFRALIPSSMQLISESLYVKNTTHPEGNKQTGDIETGINVGGYAKDGGCYIVFKCRVTGSEKNIIGKNTLRLWGQIDDGTVTLQDSADVVVIIE